MNADSIIKVLDDLTQRLSGPAAEAWGVMMRQVQIEGVVTLLGVIAGAAWLIYAARVLPKMMMRGFDPKSDDMKALVGSIITAAISFFCFIGVLVNFGDAVGKVLNPTYYVLMKIGELIK